MQKARVISGLLFMVAGAVIILFADGSYPLPVAIGLLVVGIALVASARRKANSQA